MAKKRDLMVFITGIFVLPMLITPNFALSQEKALPKFITISSYPIGSLGTILATGFSNAIEKKTGIRTRPTPADTDVGRLLPIKKGEAQAGVLTAATVYFASEGLEEFSAKDWGPQRLRLVFAGNVIHHGIAVRGDSPIKNWADLKGKKVALPPGLFALTVPAFLAYGGLTMDDVVVMRAPGYVGGIKMVMENKADACHACPVTPLMKEWESAPYKLRYLPMDPKDRPAWERMRKIAPFLAYPIWADYGALGEGGPKWMAYYPYTLSTYDTVSELVIYTIVKALVEGYDIYKDVSKPSSEEWTLKITLNLDKPVFVPFHPGLIRYAKEKGTWTAEHEAWQSKAIREEEKRIELWEAKKK
jgi:TRAP transporter TAXI family solute receptor